MVVTYITPLTLLTLFNYKSILSAFPRKITNLHPTTTYRDSLKHDIWKWSPDLSICLSLLDMSATTPVWPCCLLTHRLFFVLSDWRGWSVYGTFLTTTTRKAKDVPYLTAWKVWGEVKSRRCDANVTDILCLLTERMSHSRFSHSSFSASGIFICSYFFRLFDISARVMQMVSSRDPSFRL